MARTATREGRKRSCDCCGWRRVLCLVACPEVNEQLSAVEAARIHEWFDRMNREKGVGEEELIAVSPPE